MPTRNQVKIWYKDEPENVKILIADKVEELTKLDNRRSHIMSRYNYHAIYMDTDDPGSRQFCNYRGTFDESSTFRRAVEITINDFLAL